MLTKTHSTLSRSSASWVPSGQTPSATMRKASAMAVCASSSSQMSRRSNWSRSGVCAEEGGVFAEGGGCELFGGLDGVDIEDHDDFLDDRLQVRGRSPM